MQHRHFLPRKISIHIQHVGTSAHLFLCELHEKLRVSFSSRCTRLLSCAIDEFSDDQHGSLSFFATLNRNRWSKLSSPAKRLTSAFVRSSFQSRGGTNTSANFRGSSPIAN